MTQQQYIIRRKLSIIDLADQLGNISDACRKLGVSRQHYYDIKSAIRGGEFKFQVHHLKHEKRPHS